jgi:hypothetical protein
MNLTFNIVEYICSCIEQSIQVILKIYQIALKNLSRERLVARFLGFTIIRNGIYQILKRKYRAPNVSLTVIKSCNSFEDSWCHRLDKVSHNAWTSEAKDCALK